MTSRLLLESLLIDRCVQGWHHHEAHPSHFKRLWALTTARNATYYTVEEPIKDKYIIVMQVRIRNIYIPFITPFPLLPYLLFYLYYCITVSIGNMHCMCAYILQTSL